MCFFRNWWRRTGVDALGRFGVFVLPLLLCGCLTSKGGFLAVENASTPLPAGKYYRIASGEPLPQLTGPFTLTVKGKTYSILGGRDVVKFNLIKLVAGKDIYVAQADMGLTGAKPDAANVAILFGPITEAGFCDYSDPANGFPGVNSAGDVTSKDELRQWLVSHVDEISKMKKGVCWVKLTRDSPAG